MRRLIDRLFVCLVACLGVVFLVGGAYLLRLGGSAWYAFAGATLLGVASLRWRGKASAGTWYAAFLALTAGWSVWEGGWDSWALLPRLILPAVLGLGFLLAPVSVRRPAGDRAAIALALVLLGGLTALTLSVGGGTPVVVGAGAGSGERGTAGSDAPGRKSPGAQPDADWLHYGNDRGGSRYSPLAQIDAGNVGRLKLAWSVRTGDLGEAGQEFNFEATPIKVGQQVFACTPSGQVLALDAASGRVAWHFDGKPSRRGISTMICRGVSYYAIPDTGRTCSRRVYVADVGNRLWGLDAGSGKPCDDFGTHGAVDLTDGLGEVRADHYSVTSPPVVVRGLLVVGGRVKDNVAVDMPSGVVRAYDAVSGRLAWAWDVGREAASSGATTPVSYVRSTPNVWGPMSADEDLGLVFLPTGNAAADFWGRHRRPFDERYSAGVVAVDAIHGTTRWVFQATHHDVWDNDTSAQPSLVNWPVAGGSRPAVVIGTKQGKLFVLDRSTGEPLVPVTESPVPQNSDIGERIAPTQPTSALSVNPGPDRLTEAAMWGLTPIDQMMCRIRFRQARYDGPYTPPGISRPSIIYPGMFGGIEWGGMAFDPEQGVMVVNASAMPFLLRMARSSGAAGRAPSVPEGTSGGLNDVAGTGYAASFYGFLGPLKLPCMQPPWGKLYAIDMASGRTLWARPVGTPEDSGPFGIATHLKLTVGTPQVGGALVTAGDLIFSGATLDQYLRAYQRSSGRELWSTRLPAGGQATPMTYSVGGRQYIVIAAGGHAVLGTRRGDWLLAFTLEPPSGS